MSRHFEGSPRSVHSWEFAHATRIDLDHKAVTLLCPWACRPLQSVVSDVAARCKSEVPMAAPISVVHRAKEVPEVQSELFHEIHYHSCHTSPGRKARKRSAGIPVFAKASARAMSGASIASSVS